MSFRHGFDPETADEALTLEDAALRPTQKPWKCRKCGVELLTTELIKRHKDLCKDKPKPQPAKKPFILLHDLRKKVPRNS